MNVNSRFLEQKPFNQLEGKIRIAQLLIIVPIYADRVIKRTIVQRTIVLLIL